MIIEKYYIKTKEGYLCKTWNNNYDWYDYSIVNEINKSNYEGIIYDDKDDAIINKSFISQTISEFGSLDDLEFKDIEGFKIKSLKCEYKI